MKRRDYGKYLFAAGLLLLVLQLLMHLFSVFNGRTPDVQFAVEEKLTFRLFISQCWGSLIGTGLLGFVFIRRLVKGPDPLLVLAGALLWIIQLITLYNPDAELLSFVIRYIVGIVGTVLIIILGFYDAHYIKQHESASSLPDNTESEDKVIRDTKK